MTETEPHTFRPGRGQARAKDPKCAECGSRQSEHDAGPQPVEETEAQPPKPKSRVQGVGAACASCGSTDTKVRSTRTHPRFIQLRRRYFECASCGCVFRRDGRTQYD